MSIRDRIIELMQATRKHERMVRAEAEGLATQSEMLLAEGELKVAQAMVLQWVETEESKQRDCQSQCY